MSRKIIWKRVLVVIVIAGTLIGGVLLSYHQETPTRRSKPELEKPTLEEIRQNSIFQDNQTQQFGTPLVMAMIREDGSWSSKIMNFSFTMFQQGEWNPPKMEANSQMMLFVLGSNMTPISNGTVHLTPPLTGFSSDSSNPMSMMMMMNMFSDSEGQQSSFWQISLMTGETKMNMMTLQMMRNEGKLKINKQGFVMIQPPNMPGLWRGTVETSEGTQGFFFEVEGNGRDRYSGGDSGGDSDGLQWVSSSTVKVGESVQISAERDGTRVDGTVIIEDSDAPSDKRRLEGTGGSIMFTPATESFQASLQTPEGETIGTQTLYARTPEGFLSGVNATRIVLLVVLGIVALFIYLWRTTDIFSGIFRRSMT